jgi:hypothetical protein
MFKSVFKLYFARLYPGRLEPDIFEKSQLFLPVVKPSLCRIPFKIFIIIDKFACFEFFNEFGGNKIVLILKFIADHGVAIYFVFCKVLLMFQSRTDNLACFLKRVIGINLQNKIHVYPLKDLLMVLKNDPISLFLFVNQRFFSYPKDSAIPLFNVGAYLLLMFPQTNYFLPQRR